MLRVAIHYEIQVTGKLIVSLLIKFETAIYQLLARSKNSVRIRIFDDAKFIEKKEELKQFLNRDTLLLT